MKRSQQIIIGIGVIVVLGMCIVPPFHFPRSSEYLPIWANTAGRLDTTRLCIQIGAVAILTGGLVFLAKQRRERGNEGIIIPWGKLAATSAIVGFMLVLVITRVIIWKNSAEANGLLTSMDLSKVKLEPLEIWGSKYLKCRLYNGTDRTIDRLQVYLYVSTAPDQLILSGGTNHEPIGHMGADGRRGATLDELVRAGAVPASEGEIGSVLGGDPIKLTVVEEPAPAAFSRVYKQDFGLIGTVPPNSWSEVNIELSNRPEVQGRSHWLVLLKAARWQKASK